MRHRLVFHMSILLLAAGVVAGAQHAHDAGPGKPATLVDGLGSYHRPISTTSADAQKFFDQGLTFIYAFNHDEAVRSFERAAELDPRAAMPLWGIAYALGPNINDTDVRPRMQKAYEAVQKALSLSAASPAHERALIDALARRYATDPAADLMKLQVAYKDALSDLVKRFPDDPDIATFYAESLMNLKPWQLWTNDGQPAEGTEALVRTLEAVLRRYPDHPGANHYYIHAVEASPTPERALASASRLEALVPAAGHLVHMPAHVYIRTGDYAGAARANERAARVDEAYIAATGARGLYPMMYYAHNLHFLAAAEAMEGRYDAAMDASARLLKQIEPALKDMPMVEFFVPTPAFVMLRFGRWEDAAKWQAPAATPVLRLFQAYVSGVSLAVLGQRSEAQAEIGRFESAAKEVAPDVYFGLNPSANIINLARAVLAARIAAAGGDVNAAIAGWEKAVTLQDQLLYNEPPDWYYPVRESLGAAFMQAGRHADAETVFRTDLGKNARNARSLFGLMTALRAQKRESEAALVERELKAAWKNADKNVKLRWSRFDDLPLLPDQRSRTEGIFRK